ncbi:MAG TPA: putative porin [Gemmatimonadaceae bacterium]
MAEKSQPTPAPTQAVPIDGAKRSPAIRETDDRDPIVELTERARLISQEAGTKVSVAMRDVISAAAGIAGFAVESARDLVQYMVRRGSMTQEEADRLIREAEAAHMKRPKAERDRLAASKVAAEKAAAAKKAASTQPHRPLVPSRMVAQQTRAKAPKVDGESKTAKKAPAAAKKRR